MICSWPVSFLLLHVHKLADTTQLPGLGLVPSAQKQSGLIPGKRGREGGRDGWGEVAVVGRDFHWARRAWGHTFQVLKNFSLQSSRMSSFPSRKLTPARRDLLYTQTQSLWAFTHHQTAPQPVNQPRDMEGLPSKDQSLQLVGDNLCRFVCETRVSR